MPEDSYFTYAELDNDSNRIYNHIERYFNDVIRESKLDFTISKSHIDVFIRWMMQVKDDICGFFYQDLDDGRVCLSQELFYLFIALSRTISNGNDETGRIVSLKLIKMKYGVNWVSKCYVGSSESETWKLFRALNGEGECRQQMSFVRTIKAIRPFLIESQVIKKRKSRSKKPCSEATLVKHSSQAIAIVGSEKEEVPLLNRESSSDLLLLDSGFVQNQDENRNQNQNPNSNVFSSDSNKARVFHVSSLANNGSHYGSSYNVCCSESEKETLKVKLAERVKKKSALLTHFYI